MPTKVWESLFNHLTGDDFSLDSMGRLVLIFGPPSRAKISVSLGLTLITARSGASVEYIDANFSLSPHTFAKLPEDDLNLPIRVYRPANPREVERTLGLLSFLPEMERAWVIVLNSLTLFGRTAFLREFRVDPLYHLALLKKFTQRPKRLALAIVDSNAREPGSLPFFWSLNEVVDVMAKVSSARHPIVTLYKPPFKETYERLSMGDLPELI